MPRLEDKVGLKQKAVLWEFSKHDDRGDPQVLDPVEINVRWEKRVQELLETDQGPVSVTAEIMADRVVPVGSIMMLGTIPTDTGNGDLDGLVEVVDYSETPDIKARRYQRSLTVRKWKRSLPDIVSV